MASAAAADSLNLSSSSSSSLSLPRCSSSRSSHRTQHYLNITHPFLNSPSSSLERINFPAFDKCFPKTRAKTTTENTTTTTPNSKKTTNDNNNNSSGSGSSTTSPELSIGTLSALTEHRIQILRFHRDLTSIQGNNSVSHNTSSSSPTHHDNSHASNSSITPHHDKTTNSLQLHNINDKWDSIWNKLIQYDDDDDNSLSTGDISFLIHVTHQSSSGNNSSSGLSGKQLDTPERNKEIVDEMSLMARRGDVMPAQSREEADATINTVTERRQMESKNDDGNDESRDDGESPFLFDISGGSDHYRRFYSDAAAAGLTYSTDDDDDDDRCIMSSSSLSPIAKHQHHSSPFPMFPASLDNHHRGSPPTASPTTMRSHLETLQLSPISSRVDLRHDEKRQHDDNEEEEDERSVYSPLFDNVVNQSSLLLSEEGESSTVPFVLDHSIINVPSEEEEESISRYDGAAVERSHLSIGSLSLSNETFDAQYKTAPPPPHDSFHYSDSTTILSNDQSNNDSRDDYNNNNNHQRPLPEDTNNGDDDDDDDTAAETIRAGKAERLRLSKSLSPDDNDIDETEDDDERGVIKPKQLLDDFDEQSSSQSRCR